MKPVLCLARAWFAAQVLVLVAFRILMKFNSRID